ncbi:hypothetical protein VSH64_25050 [Amycolatopsis rhabdoformis]|uniref:Uncharacterized protein n=1 Tax=Amycolatopsis rhabdoformis TaxID=1448059 RepID=A0ABZ1HUW8_9PSEU|nr:hypothetical protein [Amycolatopsis rhabdoformis]WSE26146.1 hypothetical protein VSH64_25050 [Amycolatopsis rhabdoformis]
MPKIMEKLRWRVASLLDRSPKFCWSSLVDWSMFSGDGRTLRDCMTGRECAADRDTEPDGSCYCGKFRKDEAPKRRLTEKQTDVLVAIAGALALIVVIVVVSLGALAAVTHATPDPTMTVCRPQYGTCTEANR